MTQRVWLAAVSSVLLRGASIGICHSNSGNIITEVFQRLLDMQSQMTWTPEGSENGNLIVEELARAR